MVSLCIAWEIMAAMDYCSVISARSSCLLATTADTLAFSNP